MAALAVLPLTLAASCGDGGAVNTTEPDGGAGSSGVASAVCPGAAPRAGESCLLPEGTVCAFGSCDTQYARCTGGVWRLSPNDPGQPLCPAQSPFPGESCPPCWPVATSCLYGSADCNAPDASENRSIATCADGRWSLAFEPCRDGGGADVQRDGGADAD